MLSEITRNYYYQQKAFNSNTMDMVVKEDKSLKLTRFQDSVFLKYISMTRYD
jgi:hypothetical protein